jgi:RimJ/RimL family protein N-acetyltransferase
MIAPTLTTERLIIEPLSIGHWEAYATAWADPRMTRFIGGKPRTEAENWIKFLSGSALWSFLGYGYWAFCDRQTGHFLGSGGLAQFHRGIAELEDHIEAGWGFVPDAWGKGYATEALTMVLGWADDRLKVPEIRCIIDPGNIASHNVAAKLGFEKFAESHDVMGELFIYRRPAR